MDDSFIIGYKALESYNRLVSQYEMKYMGIPQLWCRILVLFAVASRSKRGSGQERSRFIGRCINPIGCQPEGVRSALVGILE